MRYLILLLLCTTVHAADGEFRLGIGAALNNNVPYSADQQAKGSYKGEMFDASAVWHHLLGNADGQLGYTYIAVSNFGTEQAVTFTLLDHLGTHVQLGGGLILGYTQAYEAWQTQYVSAIPVGPRQCIFCGINLQAAYEYKRVQFQIRYWRTDYNLYPGHNGALALIAVRL